MGDGKEQSEPHLPVPMRPDGSIAAMANPTFTGTPPYTGAWAGCAYDPDLPGPIYHPGAPVPSRSARARPSARTGSRGARPPSFLSFDPSAHARAPPSQPPTPPARNRRARTARRSADQVCVPTALDEVVRLYSKAAIREQPENLLEWSRQWFTAK